MERLQKDHCNCIKECVRISEFLREKLCRILLASHWLGWSIILWGWLFCSPMIILTSLFWPKASAQLRAACSYSSNCQCLVGRLLRQPLAQIWQNLSRCTKMFESFCTSTFFRGWRDCLFCFLFCSCSLSQLEASGRCLFGEYLKFNSDINWTLTNSVVGY